MTVRLLDPELVQAFRRVVRSRLEDQIAQERAEAEARRAAVLPLVRGGIDRARRAGACGRAWLFGSFAWGQPGERSDVDILVESCSDPFLFASIVGRACERDVHVVDWSDAPETLRQHVSARGLPL